MSKLIAVIITILLLSSRRASAEDTRLVVVVAAKSPVTNVSRAALKRAFLGEPLVVNETRLTPFNAEPQTAERRGFDESLLGMAADEVGRFWIDRKVRGQGAAPRSLPGAQLAKVVAKFPGAIGYVRVDQLTPDVKPVKIDGVAYDDPRYGIARR